MKRIIKSFGLIIALAIIMFSIQNTYAQDKISKSELKGLESYFGKNVPVMKGSNGTIISLSNGYCSTSPAVDVTPNAGTIPPSTSYITWTISTALAGEGTLAHPSWGTVKGTGAGMYLEFYPYLVATKYLDNANVRISFRAYDSGNNPLTPLVSDLTLVYKTATVYDFTIDVNKLCFGNSAKVTLANTETNYSYELLLDGINHQFSYNGVSGNFADWVVDNDGLNNSSGTYSVKATRATAGPTCPILMNGFPVLDIYSNPTITLQSTISAVPTTEFCAGTANVTFTAGGANEYEFFKNTIASTPVQARSTNNIYISPATLANGDKIIVVGYDTTNPTQCTGTAEVTVTVNPNPTITAGSNTPVCEGTALNLSSTPSGGSGTYTTFAWTGPNAYAGAGQNPTIPNAVLNNTGSYSVTVTDSKGCKSDGGASTSVSVNSRPTVSVGSNSPVCAGQSLVLTATPLGGSGNYVNYVWTKNSVVIAGQNAATLTINPVAIIDAATYGVTVYDNSGCFSTEATTVVVVNPLPLVTASSNSPMCVGAPINLTGGPALMNTYSWTGPNGYSNSTQSPTVSAAATLAMAGNYSLTVFDGKCSNTAITPVVVNSVSVGLSVSPAPPGWTVCQGTTLGFTANGSAGSGNYTYEFFVGPVAGPWVSQGAPSATNTLNVLINTSKRVRVNILDLTTGCTNTSFQDVTMIANPVASITAPVDNSEICAGKPVTITASPSGLGTYEFYANEGSGDVLLNSSSSNSYNKATGFTNNASIYAVVRNASGCSSQTSSVNLIVNPLPTPTLISPNLTPCLNTIVRYNTQSGGGQTNYKWIVNGGSIQSGSGNGFSFADVLWTSLTGTSVQVNYDNAKGCTATAFTNQAIAVKALPVVTITPESGSVQVCNGQKAFYVTQTGMSSYSWTVSSGGTITSNDGNGRIEVTWSGVGSQTVRVNYVNSDGCTAASPASLGITVNALPAPTFIAPVLNNVCFGSKAIYTTQGGNNGYTWSVVGGTMRVITGNSIEVTWDNPVGPYSVSVNYQASAGNCMAASPTLLPVTVKPLATPTISGSNKLCLNSTGVEYSTQAGMTPGSYVWAIVGGNANGTIDSGQGTDKISVTWLTAGARQVTVLYNDLGGCTSNSGTYNVTVDPLPNVTITGPAVVCNNTSSKYITEPGMSSYVWTPAGVQGVGPHEWVIDWTTNGLQDVTVTYTDGNGCKPTVPKPITVDVTDLPSPSISGNATVCEGHSVTYQTESNATNYDWQVVGGVLTPTVDPHIVEVVWSLGVGRQISVNYELANCPAVSPTIQAITVNPIPVVSLNGDADVCINSTGHLYTTEASQNNYRWLVDGGFITSGDGTEQITVTWDVLGAGSVSVNYDNSFSCSAVSSTVQNVMVHDILVPTITPSLTTICRNNTVRYTTEGGMEAGSYSWAVSAGGVITPTANENEIDVVWSTIGAKTVKVTYNDPLTLCSSVETTLPVTVNDVPVAGLTSSDVDNIICQGDAVTFTATGGNRYEFFVDDVSVQALSANNKYVTSTLLTGQKVHALVSFVSTSCSTKSSDIITTVNPLPTAGLTAFPSGNFIAGTSVLFTASGGDEYEFFVNGTSVQGRSTTDTYSNSALINGDVVSVRAYNSFGCYTSQALTMSVLDKVEDVNVTANRFQYCAGETGVTIFIPNPQTNITYELKESAGNTTIGAPITYTGSNSVSWPSILGTETYYVEAYYLSVPTEFITLTSPLKITENSLPAKFNLLPNTIVTDCTPQEITLDGSELDVNYQLLLDGNPRGSVVAGTGSALTFGSHSAVGVYTIQAINSTSFCTEVMTNFFQIDVPFPGTLYDIYTDHNGPTLPQDGRYCAGSSGVDLYLSGSDASTTYELYADGTPTGITANGVGDANPLDFGVALALNPPTVTVYTAFVNVAGCFFPMDSSVNVEEVALPVPYALEVENAGHYCPADVDGVEIFMLDQEDGVYYQLKLDGIDVGAPVLGVLGGRLSFGNFLTEGTYSVEARYDIIGCPVQMLNSVDVIEDALPVVYNMTSDGDFCTGSSTFVHIDGSESTVQYRWVNSDDNSFSDWLQGNGGVLDFEVNATGTYGIEAQRTDGVTGCSSVMNGNFPITSKPYADLTKDVEVYYEGTGCLDGDLIRVVAGEAGVIYTLAKDFNKIGNSVVGDGLGNAEFPLAVIDKNATYQVYAEFNGCEDILIQTVNVDVPGAITVFGMTGSGSICNGDPGVVFGLDGSESGITYSLYLADSPGSSTGDIKESKLGTNNPLSFTRVNEEGQYFVMASDGLTCNIEMLPRKTLVVNPLPTAFQVKGDGRYCASEGGAYLTLDESELDVMYVVQMGGKNKATAMGSGNELRFGPFAPLASETGLYSIVSYNTLTLCTSNMNGVIKVQQAPDIVNYNVTNTSFAYCSNTSGVDLVLENQQDGVMYRVYDAANDIILETVGNASGAELILGEVSEGTYTVEASYGGFGCITPMNGGIPLVIEAPLSSPDKKKLSIDKNNVCASVGAKLKLESSQSGVTYRLFADDIDMNMDSIGDGTDIVWDLPNTGGGVVLYSVDGIAGGTCDLTMGVVDVTYKESPLKPIVTLTGGDSYCANFDGVPIQTTTQLNMGYQLINNKKKTVGFIDGTGDLELFVGLFPVDTFLVKATFFDTGCSTFSDSVFVNVNPLPIPLSLYLNGGAACDIICNGLVNVDELRLVSSEPGYFYNLYLDRVSNTLMTPDTTLVGTGDELSFGTLSTGGTYTVEAVSLDGCYSTMLGNVFFSEKPFIAVDDFVAVPSGFTKQDTLVWFNDIHDPKIDVISGTNQNIFFKLVETVNKPVDQIINYTTKFGNKIELNANTGVINFIKKPSFYGIDSVHYEVYNTSFTDRKDIGTVVFFVGNVDFDDDNFLLIPNAFSPNGDNINDKYIITGDYANPKQVSESRLEVYNRWGTLVYRSKGNVYGVDDVFDGTSNAGAMVSLGSKLPSGTYYYVFNIVINVPEDKKKEVDVLPSGSDSYKLVTKQYNGFIELRR